jgi:hypothetical protein
MTIEQKLAEALNTANQGHYVHGGDYDAFARCVIEELAALGLRIVEDVA